MFVLICPSADPEFSSETHSCSCLQLWLERVCQERQSIKASFTLGRHASLLWCTRFQFFTIDAYKARQLPARDRPDVMPARSQPTQVTAHNLATRPIKGLGERHAQLLMYPRARVPPLHLRKDMKWVLKPWPTMSRVPVQRKSPQQARRCWAWRNVSHNFSSQILIHCGFLSKIGGWGPSFWRHNRHELF